MVPLNPVTILDISLLFSALIGGVVLGAIYALMSVGLSLSWGVFGVMNFAHGEILMVGAFSTSVILGLLGINIVFIIPMVLGLTFLIGFLLQTVVIRPLLRSGAPFLIVTIATFGVSLILQNSVLTMFGARYRQLPTILKGAFVWGDASISFQKLLIIGIVLFAFLVFELFLTRTNTGTAVRAVAQDKEVAELVGVNVQIIFAIVLGLASLMAGLAGILIGSIVWIFPAMGTEPFIKATLVVILGGLGSLRGSFVAAFIIGLIESFTTAILGVFWAPTILFVLIIAIIIIRPSGLFGGHNK